MLKGRRGREELLLSYLTVTNPARRAERRHPLNTRLSTKSAIASFYITALGKHLRERELQSLCSTFSLSQEC